MYRLTTSKRRRKKKEGWWCVEPKLFLGFFPTAHIVKVWHRRWQNPMATTVLRNLIKLQQFPWLQQTIEVKRLAVAGSSAFHCQELIKFPRETHPWTGKLSPNQNIYSKCKRKHCHKSWCFVHWWYVSICQTFAMVSHTSLYFECRTWSTEWVTFQEVNLPGKKILFLLSKAQTLILSIQNENLTLRSQH